MEWDSQDPQLFPGLIRPPLVDIVKESLSEKDKHVFIRNICLKIHARFNSEHFNNHMHTIVGTYLFLICILCMSAKQTMVIDEYLQIYTQSPLYLLTLNLTLSGKISYIGCIFGTIDAFMTLDMNNWCYIEIKSLQMIICISACIFCQSPIKIG